MKRIFLIATVLALLLALCACVKDADGGGNDDGSGDNSSIGGNDGGGNVEDDGGADNSGDVGAMVLGEVDGGIRALGNAQVTKVRISTYFVGVAPGNIKTHYYVYDTDEIRGVVASIADAQLVPISKDEGEIDGGSAVDFRFVTDGAEDIALSLNNGNYRDEAGNYYRVEGLSVPDGEPSAFSFITYGELCTAYRGSEKICDGIDVGEYEFRKYEGPIPLIIPTIYIECSFGALRIYNDSIFSYEKSGASGVEYFQLTEDFSFNFLFE